MPEADGPVVVAALTKRETLVLRLVADGQSTGDIAAEVGCTVPEVRACLADVRRRLGARNVAHVIAMVIRAGAI